MKLFAYILAINVLFLSALPGADSLAVKQNTELSCCGTQCAIPPPADADLPSQNQNHKDDCTGQTCNPFQLCCTCVLPCIDSDHKSLHKLLSRGENTTEYRKILTSSYVSDFGQPPKNV